MQRETKESQEIEPTLEISYIKKEKNKNIEKQ